jgi:hypothetical protein
MSSSGGSKKNPDSRRELDGHTVRAGARWAKILSGIEQSLLGDQKGVLAIKGPLLLAVGCITLQTPGDPYLHQLIRGFSFPKLASVKWPSIWLP